MAAPGLDLTQAPPFAAPLRFFLGAPLFLAAAGLLAAADAAWSRDVQALQSLALVHLLVLGFLGMVMLGALTQMLPVLAGAPLPGLKGVIRLAHGGLLLGTPLLAWGLAGGGPLPLTGAGCLLALGLLPFLLATALSLARGRRLDTTRAMALALLALAATLALGLVLLTWLAGLWSPADPADLLARHALMGLGGWIGILVMGVAWQVVPMLQLTPAYPPALTRALLLAGALGLAVILLAPPAWRWAGETLLALAALAFAVGTLDRQWRRKRRVPDVTLDYWRLGMACLIAAVLLLPVADEGRTGVLAGLLFLAGFAVAVVNGMLFKIVPFLAWFHLQAQKGILAQGLPSMKDYLPDGRARIQFRLHLAALACLLGAPFLPWLAVPGGVLLALSAVWLGMALFRAAILFHRQGGRF
ncbi:MAG: hypothetical protein AB1899_18205 [Pseudomonadota bacterium]